MRYLSHVTKDPSYAERANAFYRIRKQRTYKGLWPNCWKSGRGKITMGADGDSFYEYIVKAWAQDSGKDDELWDMYDKAADSFAQFMVHKGQDNLKYIGTLFWSGGDQARYQPEMEHLTCFVPGWLAIGAMSTKGEAKRATRME